MKRIVPVIALFLLFLCQLPFLTADPDTLVDVHTRGAWTDEGLYTSQIRNYVNLGTFDTKENSTFVRGPLFNIVQYPFFKVFGTHLIVSRLIVLVFFFSVLLLFCFLEGYESWAFFLILINATEFHLFQFSHYGLAEMMCNGTILLGLYFLIRNRLLLSALMLFFTYALKIQFLYVALLLPGTLMLMDLFRKKNPFRNRAFYQSVAYTLILYVVYGIWYFLNKGYYDFIMMNETNGRFPADLQNFILTIRYNTSHYIWDGALKPLFILLPVLLVIFFIQKKKAIQAPTYLIPLVFSGLWILLELHKIPMTYIPKRYLLSFFLAAGLMTSTLMAVILRKNKDYLAAVMTIVLIYGFVQMFHNYQALQRRTYDLKTVSDYLKKTDFQGRYALGSWATSTTWETYAHSIPVWNQYFNWKDPLKQFHPKAIITETDQSETDKAYISQGIDLQAVSDSVKTFRIWRYEVKVYWIREK